ncbi:nucleotide-binding protein [Pseudosulfitobacter pseudonitzschiae]|uniref:nucleotide-binding protein n=1 Tax=Pseudosulfitobacter pseudonitzschiae TaxID=1402135 RepID=UPI003B7CC701
MRYLINFLSVAMVALLLAAPAQAETISARDAPQYIGQEMTVEGVVSQVSSSSGGTTFINFGGRYPNHTFYGVIFRNSASHFSGVHALEGKTVAISGTLKLYKGKPQIILSSPNQIKVR